MNSDARRKQQDRSGTQRAAQRHAQRPTKHEDTQQRQQTARTWLEPRWMVMVRFLPAPAGILHVTCIKETDRQFSPQEQSRTRTAHGRQSTSHERGPQPTRRSKAQSPGGWHDTRRPKSLALVCAVAMSRFVHALPSMKTWHSNMNNNGNEPRQRANRSECPIGESERMLTAHVEVPPNWAMQARARSRFGCNALTWRVG